MRLPFSWIVPSLVGQSFGRLSVVARAESNGQLAFWKCLCACGNSVTVAGAKLTSGHTNSCGCLRSEVTALRSTKHGMKRTLAYKSWEGLRARCNCPTNRKYARYGGRGITVCERWDDFANFFADMGERPSRHHSIERMNNDGNYEPGNCKWALPPEQSRNKTHKTTTGVNGVYYKTSRQKYQARIGYGSERKSLGHFSDFFTAVAARKSAEMRACEAFQK